MKHRRTANENNMLSKMENMISMMASEKPFERLQTLEQKINEVDKIQTIENYIIQLKERIWAVKEVLTTAEASAYLGLSESYIYKLTSLKQIPHYKPNGKLLYFNRKELCEWAMRNQVQTVGQPATITKQEVQNTTEQAVTQQIEESEMSGQSHSEAITQEEQGQQTVQSDTRTNENGWNGLFSSLGLNGMGDIGRNLGYVLSMLPDILVGMFTGRTKSLDIGDNIVPMASVLAGLFVKNPVLKMLMIGLGGANLLNKAGHEAIDWKRNEGNSRPVSENRPVQYRSYPDEPLNPRISNPILKGNNLIATIDRVPCTIQLPEKVTAAYHAGALPLNTLANAILAKSDQTRAMMERNFENGERETIIRTRGIQ